MPEVNMDLAKVSDPPAPVVAVATSNTSQITSDCVYSMNALQSTTSTYTSPFTSNFQSCSVTTNIIEKK